MKAVIIACAVFSLAPAAVIPDESQAQIINYQSNNDGTGNYEFSYETSNGIKREESGRQETKHLVVKGSYSYTDADGSPVVVRYLADENGYQVNPAPDFLPPPAAFPSGNVVTLLLGK